MALGPVKLLVLTIVHYTQCQLTNQKAANDTSHAKAKTLSCEDK